MSQILATKETSITRHLLPEKNARKKDVSVSVGRLDPGHYNLKRMAEEMKNIFKIYNYNLDTEINTPLGQLEIKGQYLLFCKFFMVFFNYCKPSYAFCSHFQ